MGKTDVIETMTMCLKQDAVKTVAMTPKGDVGLYTEAFLKHRELSAS